MDTEKWAAHAYSMLLVLRSSMILDKENVESLDVFLKAAPKPVISKGSVLWADSVMEAYRR